MALSKCPHCGNGFFELQSVSPSGSNFKMNFIQCSMCGAPMGTAEYFDSGSLLKKQEAVLGKHGSTLDDIERRVKRVEQIVAHIANSLQR